MGHRPTLEARAASGGGRKRDGGWLKYEFRRDQGCQDEDDLETELVYMTRGAYDVLLERGGRLNSHKYGSGIDLMVPVNRLEMKWRANP